MEITVQIFGIRWLRLLFIREFHLHDLLFLWDVILSDRPILNLVDYVFLALLIQIRELLLHSDYSATLHYLMRFPPIADIYSFIQLVLHLKFPRVRNSD
jgi:TBC1 domain family protein 5